MRWRRRDPSRDYDAAHAQITRERIDREREHELPDGEPEEEEEEP